MHEVVSLKENGPYNHTKHWGNERERLQQNEKTVQETHLLFEWRNCSEIVIICKVLLSLSLFKKIENLQDLASW
jgi:hypothetical protein